MKTIRQQFPKSRTYLLRRKRRYEVDARRRGGGRRFYFTDRPSAVRKAQELAALAEVQPLTPLPVEVQRPDLLQRLLSLLENQSVPAAPTTGRCFPDLLDEWVQSRRDDKFKPLRPRSFQSIRMACHRFKELFGRLPLSALDRERVEAVFTRQEWSPQSLKNYRSYLSQFFNWSLRRGLATTNPLQHLQVATVSRTVEVYSLEQVRTMLTKVQEPEFVGLVPYLTLSLFAGIRPLEAQRMTWERNLRLDTAEIEIQGDIAKTKRPRRFEMEPVLVSWLTHYRRCHPEVQVVCPNFGRLFRSFQQRLGFPWIADGLRHTFGTFHYNRDKSLGHLTFIMGNSESVARRHYLTTLPQGDVGQFWKLGPTGSLEC
jgi:integrase